MRRLAWRNLIQDRFRLFISVSGVALSMALILLIGGIFTGSEEQAVLYIRKQPADLWLMQEGVANMHMSSSILPVGVLEEVRSVEGVKTAVGILYTNATIKVDDIVIFNYVIGIEEDAPIGGPWKLAEGTTNLTVNEIVIDQAVARRYGLEIGDPVQIGGFDVRIAGLSEDTFGIATSVVWVSKAAMAALMGVDADANSYILIEPQAGVEVQALKERLATHIPDANILTSDEFAESDQEMIRQMGADLIGMMNSIAYIIGLVIIGITVYTATLERSREYGVLKAIGANHRHLLLVVLIQAFVIAGTGSFVGILLSYGIGSIINEVFPEMLVLIRPAQWLVVLPVMAAVTAVGALLPIQRIMKLDPMIVFKS